MFPSTYKYTLFALSYKSTERKNFLNFISIPQFVANLFDEITREVYALLTYYPQFFDMNFVTKKVLRKVWEGTFLAMSHQGDLKAKDPWITF